MRATAWSLLLLGCAACAARVDGARDADEAFRELQRERLLRLYQPRDAAAALAELRAHAPGRQDPERGHLDQREPPALGSGMRRFHGDTSALALHVAVGGGTLAARLPGTKFDDHTAVQSLLLRLDTSARSDVGAGLQLRALRSDGDLFAGRFLNDGVEPRPADARLDDVDVFPHLRLDALLADRVAGDLRVGFFVAQRELDHEAADVQRRWLSAGARAVAEVSTVLVGNEAGHLDLFGRASGDGGIAWFRDDYRNGEDRDTTWRATVGAAAGLRWAMDGGDLEAGCALEQTWFGGTNTDLFGDRARVEFQLRQWFVGGSLRF